MRIVTNGKHYAIVKRRWIFTQFLDLDYDDWSSIFHRFHIKFYSLYWRESLQEVHEIFKEKKRRDNWNGNYKDVGDIGKTNDPK
jgi:hypothetical protein